MFHKKTLLSFNSAVNIRWGWYLSHLGVHKLLWDPQKSACYSCPSFPGTNWREAIGEISIIAEDHQFNQGLLVQGK